MTLPAGLVTFCFTDIEGSTQLFASQGPAYLDLLEEHRKIVRNCITQYGGAEVNTEGDGFFIAFASPAQAVAGCVAMQRALGEHAWPDDAAVRVRIGMHVGEATPIENDYMSYAVHEAARVGAAGHGGQIVITDALADLVRDALDDDVTLRDLGEHEFKDVSVIRVHQVCATGLPDAFPELRTVGGQRGYVPATTASLIGREHDLADLRTHLGSTRLLTITGSGGVGKTRLAIELARGQLGLRTDGVWFIDLAPVLDADRVADTFIDALGVLRDTVGDPVPQLISYLRRRDLLIVVDNCEHVIERVGRLVADILSSCPSVTVLTTSRESLGVDGEFGWRLRSLDVSESASLFVERARGVRPDIDADDPSIERIAERLDGIPLAIELAAARTRVLTSSQIAERLDDRFRLLTGGSKTSLARQRTLEATVDWSYTLLDDDEQALFRCVSVFVGGFDLAAVEAVWDGDALDLLDRLVDKSMVITTLGVDTVRYRLLETIRHYGWMKLIDAGEADGVRKRHLRCYAELVAGVAPGLRDDRELTAAWCLSAENDNIRAALEWAIASEEHATALEIVSEYWMFWAVRGRMREGLEWIERVFEVAGDLDPELVALTHMGASHLYWIGQSSAERVGYHALQAVEHVRARAAATNNWFDGWALSLLTMANWHGPSDLPLHEEAALWSKRGGDAFAHVQALDRLSVAIAARDGNRAAVPTLEEAVSVARKASASAYSYALQALAQIELELGERDRAVSHAQEALAAARRGPNVHFVCFALLALGFCDIPASEDHLREAVTLAREAGLDFAQAEAEVELGWIHLGRQDPAVARGHFERAFELVEPIAMNSTTLLYFAGLARQGIAETYEMDGRYAEARQIFSENLMLAEGVEGSEAVIAVVTNALGWLSVVEGELDDAKERFRAAIDVSAQATQDIERARHEKATAVRGLAAIAHRRGDHEPAARLLGATSRVADLIRNPKLNLLYFRDTLKSVRDALGDESFDRFWDEGVAMGLEAAIDHVTPSPARDA